MNPQSALGGIMELNKENYLKLRDSKRYTRPQMAGIFNVPDWKLKKWIATNKLGVSRPQVRNPKAFEEHNPQSDYWAGFIAADGCVDKKGRVRLYLQLSDNTHLSKFADFVGSSHKINLNDKRNRCSIEFTCSRMVADLAKWGIVPQKSLTYVPPDSMRGNPHFMGGWFDGDGTICESFSNKNSRTATLYAGIAVSYPSHEWLVKEWDSLGINVKAHNRDNHVTITMNTNKSKVFLSYIYKESTEGTRLDRKYALYNSIVVKGNRKTR